MALQSVKSELLCNNLLKGQGLPMKKQMVWPGTRNIYAEDRARQCLLINQTAQFNGLVIQARVRVPSSDTVTAVNFASNAHYPKVNPAGVNEAGVTLVSHAQLVLSIF